MAYFDEESAHDFWEVSGAGDSPEKNLLFAVLMQAIKDCGGSKTVTDDYRCPGEAAAAGRCWFRERSRGMVGWGLVIEQLGISPETAVRLEYCARNGLDPFATRFSFYRTNNPKRHVPSALNSGLWKRKARQFA
jgi:hypothetical protein